MATQQTQKDIQDNKAADALKADRNGGPGNGAHTVEEAVERTAAAVDNAADVAAARAHDMADAVKSSYGVFADGIQELQQVYWQMVQQSFDLAATTPSELMRCKTVSEIAEIQRGIMHRYLDGIVDANRTLMSVSGRVTENASRPLREHLGRQASWA